MLDKLLPCVCGAKKLVCSYPALDRCRYFHYEERNSMEGYGREVRTYEYVRRDFLP